MHMENVPLMEVVIISLCQGINWEQLFDCFVSFNKATAVLYLSGNFLIQFQHKRTLALENYSTNRAIKHVHTPATFANTIITIGCFQAPIFFNVNQRSFILCSLKVTLLDIQREGRGRTQ